jgi:uncharacterized protein YcgI (DUF1989 family)
MMKTYGRLREDYLVQPISGKALPVYKGEVLRIIQEEGGQCVDFNSWNLHDWREFMDTSIMRRQGFHLEKDDFLISNSPHNRLMMEIVDKTTANIIDVIVHRCSAAMVEAAWEVDNHSNCQDSLAESIGEYGLTPDHTHAVLCPYTPTDWNSKGKFHLESNRAVKKGDSMDLLALMDVLTASCVCGITDYSPLGNYFPRPIRLQIFEASPETQRMVEAVSRRFPPLKTQRTPKDYRVRIGKDEDYEIKKNPGYVPKFINFPQKVQTLEVELPDEDYEQVQKQVELGLRDDDDDAVSTAVMEWYLKNRTKRHPIWGTIGGYS